MKKVPFDVKYKKQILSGEAKVITREGREVRIVDWALQGNYPILAVIPVNITNYEGDESWIEERPYAISNDGKRASGFCYDKYDLFVLVEDETKVTITSFIINYIKEHQAFFENTIPELGDVWTIEREVTYPNVNSGKPVVELISDNGEWMRLPKDVIELKDTEETTVSTTESEIDYNKLDKMIENELGLKEELKFSIGDVIHCLVYEPERNYKVETIEDSHYIIYTTIPSYNRIPLNFSEQDKWELVDPVKQSSIEQLETAVSDLLSPYCMVSEERARYEANKLLGIARKVIENDYDGKAMLYVCNKSYERGKKDAKFEIESKLPKWKKTDGYAADGIYDGKIHKDSFYIELKDLDKLSKEND